MSCRIVAPKYTKEEILALIDLLEDLAGNGDGLAGHGVDGETGDRVEILRIRIY